MKTLFRHCLFALCFSVLIGLVISRLSCPSYDEIAETSSVSSFEAASLSGLWFMVATNEPTLPKKCTCSTNNYTVDSTAEIYEYTNADRCFDTMDIQVHIAGTFNASQQGNLMENAVVRGKQLTPLKPNYIFAVDYNSSGDPSVVYSYACLGKGLFSYNVLSRENTFDEDAINALVSDGVARAGVDIDSDSMRLSTESDYESCAAEK